MNYDYKIINTDPTLAFIKRMLLYISILSITVALALIVLFILFERYLMLLLPGGIILLAGSIVFLLAKKVTIIEYHFTDRSLRIIKGRKIFDFTLSEVTIERNAENSDFFKKDIVILSFIKNRIVLKLELNDNTYVVSQQVIRYGESEYLIALDDYAFSRIKGANDEH